MTMRPITFILCATHAEAQQIATAAGLDNWRWLDKAQTISGFRQPNVWRTPCWFYRPGYTAADRYQMRMALAAAEATIKTIDCLHGGRIPAGDAA